jgi:hypothetical protein
LNPLWVAAVYGEIPAAATLLGGALIVASLAARYAVRNQGVVNVER